MNGLLFFLSSLGVFNGILLSLYLFFFTKQKSLAKYLLGALILALSIRIGKSVLLYFDRDLPKIYLQIGLSACLFIGPFLYFYLKAVVQDIRTFPKRWKLIVSCLAVCIVSIGTFRPYAGYPEFWNDYVVGSIYLTWLLFVILAGFAIRLILKKAIRQFNKLLPSEKWLVAIYLANVIIATAFYLAFFGFSWAFYMSGPLVFSFFLYLLAFGYFNAGWFEIETKKPLEKYSNKKIESPEAKALLEQLDVLMKTKHIYTDSTLKLNDVAVQLKIPAHQLSQLLNDNLGKSYSSFVNEYRIRRACELVETQHNLTLEGIGYEVGFRSKSTFFTTFKKMMGVTPSQYQKQRLVKNA